MTGPPRWSVPPRWLAAIALSVAAAAGGCSDSSDDAVVDGHDAGSRADGGANRREDASRDASDAALEAEGGAFVPADAAAEAGRDAAADVDAGGDPVCEDQCPVDDLRCTGARLERCRVDALGCSSFELEADCAETSQACAQDASGARCEAPPETCEDGEPNQDETDVDCGGERCAACDAGEGCALDRDCAQGVCFGGRCVAEAPLCESLFSPPDDFAEPNSLPWPLIARDSGVPRQALGSSFGEYQYYGALPYVHSGIDIRGLEGDHVKVVADGNIWSTANLAQCEEGAGDSCRLYIRDLAGRYIYYYSHLRFSASDPMSVELRAAIMAATARTGTGGYEVQPGTEVSAGQTLSAIADFLNNEWAHLHFNVFDAQQNYDGINPLSALVAGEGGAPLDDEPPFVATLEWRADTAAGTPTPLSQCDELSGAVDLIAQIGDAFFTNDPAPEAIPGTIDSIGIYRARTSIEELSSGAVTEIDWYDFSRAPFACTGPERGADCADPSPGAILSEADFFAQTVDQSTGAPNLAQAYAPVLFDVAGSDSSYASMETYRHILTHSWGQPGAWDTTAGADGAYRVSVEAFDQAGNAATLSRLVIVDNAGALAPGDVGGDAHLRDHPRDVGAVPSTLGGEASWASPDILVVPADQAVDVDSVAGTFELAAETEYDVYVRVHNESCAPVDGIVARVSVGPPDLANFEDERLPLTGGAFVGDADDPAGLSLSPGQRGLLGPFRYTPSAAELEGYGGFRALLAEIDAPTDPRGESDTPGFTDAGDVAADNNAALRSVRVHASPGPRPSFAFGNPGPGGACLELVVELLDVPLTDAATSGVLRVPDHAALLGAWADVPGAPLVHDAAAGVIELRFTRRRVALPAVTLPAGTRLIGELALEAPVSATDAHLRVAQYLGGRLSGGVDLRAFE